ncbi:MAG TPA: class I SAM-dependent methyltransferase [Candidatus Woesebacteria bacterium]|nr:class I SAM-dependent methyltransferase [Candidatus Woesebacteria bacterium]
MQIVEKKLGISPDYQYRAMTQSSWIKRNWHQNKFDIVRQIHKFNKNEEILDLGTGSGNFELIFARSVKHIYGVDYNDDALSFLDKLLTKKRIKNVTLECSDMRKLSSKLNRKKYNLIVSIDTIEHVSKKDGAKIVEWSKNRLKKNGRLIIITPNYESVWVFLEKILDFLSFTPKMGRHQHMSKYSVSSMRKMLLEHGFSVNKEITFNLFSFILPNKINQNLLRIEGKLHHNRGCLMAVEAINK